jgi:hypothetical protein
MCQKNCLKTIEKINKYSLCGKKIAIAESFGEGLENLLETRKLPFPALYPANNYGY